MIKLRNISSVFLLLSLSALMLEDKDSPLINVHIPYEGEVEGGLNELPTDESARLALYCRSGSMGTTAALTLVGLGYTDVWNLDGRIIGWKRAGLPTLENSP